MLFGSDEMKELMLTALSDESYRSRLEKELYNAVKGATVHKLTTGFAEGAVRPNSKPLYTGDIKPEEYRDIVDTVFCNVYMHLDDFIRMVQERGYVAAQRQHWLNLYIYGEIAGYLKERNATPYDDTTGGTVDPVDPSKGDFVREIVKVACSAPSKGEKKMAFVYNVVIFRELMARNKNGAAENTSDFMNGKQLFRLKELMVNNVNSIYSARVGDREIAPLNDEFGKDAAKDRGNEICEVTPKLVSDWSNRIKAYIYKHRDQINGEGQI